MLLLGVPITLHIFLILPGIALVLVNLTWMALLLGVVCTRFRDMPNIIASILQVAFYLTPIIWMPNLLPERAGTMLLDINPFLSLARNHSLTFLGPIAKWHKLVFCLRHGCGWLGHYPEGIWALSTPHRVLVINIW